MAPSLAKPSLADAVGDAVDAAALEFLVWAALKTPEQIERSKQASWKQRKEAAKNEKEAAKEEASSSQRRRKKRKKKKKHVSLCSLRRLGLSHVFYVIDLAALVVDNGSDMFCAGFTTKGGVSGPAEDVLSRGGGRGKFSAGRPGAGAGCRFTSQEATRRRYQEGQGKVRSHLPSTRRFLVSNLCHLDADWTSGNRWAGRRCVEPHGREFGC